MLNATSFLAVLCLCLAASPGHSQTDDAARAPLPAETPAAAETDAPPASDIAPSPDAAPPSEPDSPPATASDAATAPPADVPAADAAQPTTKPDNPAEAAPPVTIAPVESAPAPTDAEVERAAEEALKARATDKDEPAAGDSRTSQRKIQDPDGQGAKMATGSIDVCETLTAPIGLIPYVGSVVGLVIDWACLVPGAMAMDYTQLYHGEKDTFVWQALVGLVLAKLWRDVTRWPVVIGISVAALGAAAVVIATAIGFSFVPGNPAGVLPAYAPVAITGVLVGAGATYIGMRKLRKWGQGKIFEWTYAGLAADFDDEETQKAKQEEAWVHPPLNGVERLWSLASMAGGSDTGTELLHFVPVVGRVAKAGAKAEALKADMRDLANNGLHEDQTEEELSTMDTTVDVLLYTEGYMAAAADVFLIAAGAAFLGGTGFAGFWLTQSGNSDTATLATYAAILGGVGVVGIGLALSGVGLLLAREIPRFLKPILVPLAYGPFPVNTGWFSKDADDDDGVTEPGDEE